MKRYKLIKKIGEGTFSEVVKTQSLKDGKFYACKTMKQTINSLEQANNLREVQAMKRLGPHANIVQLHELIYNKDSGTVSLVCELMEMNIYEFIRGRRSPLPEQTVKLYMFQLCRSLEHMHRCGIFHRDVKPENILIRQNVLKLGDFGSCRSVYSRPPHTEYISTRWYRAPECLLTDGYYSLKMDLWSAGCVFFEIMSLNPLFPGTNEVDQISKIHDVLGTPEPSVLRKLKQSRSIQFNFTPRKGSGLSRLIPNCPAPALSLLYQMLAYDADERITADTALRHTYFTDRLVEKKSESFSRQEGAAQSWGPTRTRGRHARQTPLHNKHVSHYTTHLPRLSLPQTSSSSEPGLTFTHRDSLPAITKRSVVKVTTGRREEASSLSLQPRDESRRDVFTGFLLPPLERKHGGS